MIFIEFIVKVFTGQYKFVELKPREINFTFWLAGVCVGLTGVGRGGGLGPGR